MLWQMPGLVQHSATPASGLARHGTSEHVDSGVHAMLRKTHVPHDGPIGDCPQLLPSIEASRAARQPKVVLIIAGPSHGNAQDLRLEVKVAVDRITNFKET